MTRRDARRRNQAHRPGLIDWWRVWRVVAWAVVIGGYAVLGWIGVAYSFAVLG